jgi:hypothetical protein
MMFFSEEDSVFDESDVHDTPTGAGNKESQTFFARLKRIGGSKSVKYQPVELNAQKSMKVVSKDDLFYPANTLIELKCFADMN